MEECRRNHLDRETLTLTKEFEDCSDQCMIVYKSTCTKGEGSKSVVNSDDFAREGMAGLGEPNEP